MVQSSSHASAKIDSSPEGTAKMPKRPTSVLLEAMKKNPNLEVTSEPPGHGACYTEGSLGPSYQG